MTDLERLRRLGQQNADVSLVLTTFSAIEQVYRGSLQAMGLVPPPQKPQVSNAADAQLSGPLDLTRQ